MDNGLLTQLGVGGIFAIMLIDKAFNFVVKYKNGKNGDNEINVDSIKKALSDISGTYRVISAVDENGSPLVYAPRSWGRDLKQVSECQRDTAQALERVAKTLDKMESKLG